MSAFRAIWGYATSRWVREAVDFHRFVRRKLALEKDRLPPEVRRDLTQALTDLNRALSQSEPPQLLQERIAALEAAARPWLGRVRPHRYEELSRLLLLAGVLILAVRTFFLQPMKIPTGSMQPTLYGITVQDLRGEPDQEVPTGLAAFSERIFRGRSYYHVVAKTGGMLTSISPPEPVAPWLRWLPNLRKQRFVVGSTEYTLWMPPWDLPNPFSLHPNHILFAHAGLVPNRWYGPGDDLIRVVVESGDHVLVDRLTYHFRRPRRGEIIVFRSAGIPGVQEGTYYLKRLVGLPGERIRLGNDRHLVVNGRRLDATEPHFEKVYTFEGRPRENEYAGHVNDAVARREGLQRGVLAPRFPNDGTEFRVRPKHYLVMGDNTMSSLDGRRWGDFPEEKVVGRYCMVYWPLGPRFGWGAR